MDIFTCNICGKPFETQHNTECHNKLKHSDTDNSDNSKVDTEIVKTR